MSERYKLPSSRLFQAIQNGLTADEAYLPIENNRLAQIRGIESEVKVRTLLSKSDLVNKVFINRHRGKLDATGKDLTVYLNKKEKRDNDHVYVQVKSSTTGIRAWENELKGKFNIDNDALSKFLLSERLMILNASWEDEVILGQFEWETQRINDYLHQIHGHY